MERSEHYTLGRKVKVESDHKPLEIINKKSLISAPKRLQRMLLRLQKFDYEIVYKRGLEMYLADTLSRAYLPTVQLQKHDSEDRVLAITDRSKSEKDAESITMSEYANISSDTLKKIKLATSQDEILLKLSKTIKDGWPERDELPPDIQFYHTFRDELVSQDGLIFKGDRIVIPLTLKDEILQRVHSSHIGIQGCYLRTKESLYWPNMMKAIETYIKKCHVCATIQGEQDFFEIDRLHDRKSKEVINKFKAQMARHGIPGMLISDNGPPFEMPVGQQRPFLALLDWRNTPSENIGSSAVQRLMGRRTRTLLPTKSKLLKPSLPTNVKEQLAKRKSLSEFYYNRTAKNIPKINIGETVRIRPFGKEKTWTKAKVDEKVNIRSYQVTTEDGRTYRRNRKHLRRSNEPFIGNNVVDPPNFDNVMTDKPPSAENPKPSADKITPIRRSTRQIKMPKRFEDFNIYK
ncbi:uncharacterized protein LOC133198137 [Saccostrea echinata]|uniref:uncharacterized protein LOC133198137 n=1 Tax=Saccostrea echinata TaxID=191078 RepID=UPI002A83C22E|nr:uncharacterized protein LOC133198137 [Saccostrea echinata]